MITKSKRILSSVLAMILLITGLLPMSVSAADVTMDLSKAEVSWDYTLTDEEGNAFAAAYGLKAEDNPFGGAISPMLRRMHDYTAKLPDSHQTSLSGYTAKTMCIASALNMVCLCRTQAATAVQAI